MWQKIVGTGSHWRTWFGILQAVRCDTDGVVNFLGRGALVSPHGAHNFEGMSCAGSEGS